MASQDLSLAQTKNYHGLEMCSGAANALYRIATTMGKIEAIAMVRWKTGMGLVERLCCCNSGVGYFFVHSAMSLSNLALTAGER